MRWVLCILGRERVAEMLKTPSKPHRKLPQNTPFLALLQRNAKAEYANYNNINALHFCILHFENVEECTLNRITKKPLKFSDFLIVIYNKLFADAETHCL